jgi:hypothetical protein
VVARNSPSLSTFSHSRQHRTEPLIARLNLTRAPPITDSARSDSMRNACYSVRPAKPGARAHTCISFLLCDEYALSRVLWFPLCWFFCRAILFLELKKLYKTDRIPSMGPAKRLQMTPARAITYVFLSFSSSFSFFCTTCRRPYRHCARRPWRRIKGANGGPHRRPAGLRACSTFKCAGRWHSTVHGQRLGQKMGSRSGLGHSGRRRPLPVRAGPAIAFEAGSGSIGVSALTEAAGRPSHVTAPGDAGTQ